MMLRMILGRQLEISKMHWSSSKAGDSDYDAKGGRAIQLSTAPPQGKTMAALWLLIFLPPTIPSCRNSS